MALFLRRDDVAKDKIRTSKLFEHKFFISFRWFKQEKKTLQIWLTLNKTFKVKNITIKFQKFNYHCFINNKRLTDSKNLSYHYISIICSLASHEHKNYELIIDGPNRWTFMIKKEFRKILGKNKNSTTQKPKHMPRISGYTECSWFLEIILFIYLSEENNCCDSAIPIYFIEFVFILR